MSRFPSSDRFTGSGPTAKSVAQGSGSHQMATGGSQDPNGSYSKSDCSDDEGWAIDWSGDPR